MKKTIALLLTAVLLLGAVSGCASGPAAQVDEMPDPEIDQGSQDSSGTEDAAGRTDLTFERDVEAQAFAAAMACHTDDVRGSVDLKDTELLWNMAGWYAAWMSVTSGYDLIPVSRVEDFLRSLGSAAPPEPPGTWVEYGIIAALTAPDGNSYYAFPIHKERMDALLGVTIEVNVTAEEGGAANAAVTEHFENDASVSWDYALTFVKNPDADSAFPWRLKGMEAPGDGPVILGEINFTWEELAAQNSMKKILSICPAIRFYGEGLNEGMSGWIFPRDVGLAQLFLWGSDISGQYRGCEFEYQTWSDGEKRAMVGAMDENYGSWEYMEDYMLNYFTSLLSMSFDHEDEELFWFDCVGMGGLRVTMAVDKLTLMLRRQEVYYSDNDEASVTVFDYGSTGPAYEFFDSWDGPMRSVTLHWESFETGSPVTRTEVRVLPADWEYLPYDARWGDYTIWMDAGYTRPYVYPGPGGDYSLYLTTAKG